MDKKYHEYLQSDEWKEKRKEIFEFIAKKCAKCKTTENIQLHHRSYENIYQESFSDVVPLCETCHKLFHSTFWTENLKDNTFLFVHWKEKFDELQRMKNILKAREEENKRNWVIREEHDEEFWHNNPLWLQKHENRIWIWNTLKQYQEYRHWDDPIKYPIPDSDDLNIALDATIKFMLNI